MKLIDKDALVAEIERRIKEYQSTGDDYWFPVIENLKNILSFINTLEMKGVDLDEEADNYWGTLTSDVRNSIYFNDFYKVAKHFFELGMWISNKAQKGEEV